MSNAQLHFSSGKCVEATTPAEKLHDAAARFLFQARTTLLWETQERQARFEGMAVEFVEALKAFEDAEGITVRRRQLPELEHFDRHSGAAMTLSEEMGQ